jgi:putative GTP pyrophosphokinase
MIDLEQVRKNWLCDQPRYGQLSIRLADRLKEEVRREGIWAEITSRPKEMDSLIRKLIKKPGHTYESIGDKAGVRIIVRYRDEVELILGIVTQRFDLSAIENVANRLRPEVVGYLSVHATLRFRRNDPNAIEFPPDRFVAELQVRTMAQHLWADLAHDTVYKHDDTLLPLPDPVKRRIYILAGIFELADQEFNRIEREIPSVPEFNILRALERYHYRLTSRRGDRETSLEMIRLLSPLYRGPVSKIIAHLGEFYSSVEETLRTVYEREAQIADRSAFLFQPELLMIYDLLTTDPLATQSAWNQHYPEKELERIANSLGISFD